MTRPARPVRGLGLVEILVALALGLFLVSAAISLFVGQLREHRLRLLDVRVTQELRTAAALMERDLRRAGHWGRAEQALWQPGSASAPAANPYTGIHPADGDNASLGYAYSRDASENGVVDSNERYGFRLNATTRALEMRLGGNALVPADGDSWQPMTDPALLRITRLAFSTQSRTLDLGARCSLACAGPGSAANPCPPTQTLRLVTIELEGQATADAAIRRALRSSVRLRTDPLQGQCTPG